MPQRLEQKMVDPESELNNAKRVYTKLAPKCSVKWMERGEAQLVLPEKQVALLKHELSECETDVRLAKSGKNGQIDANIQRDCLDNIKQYEYLGIRLRDEKAQLTELDLLNYLSQKKIHEIGKKIPSEVEERNMIERHELNLRRMNNRLEIATKRFCSVRNDNMKIREEIQMLLVEREGFNIQWNRMIWKLMKGKEYLMDILEVANQLFEDRDKYCKKLEALKWKGLFQLNRDIVEMQTWQCELSHAADVEQFLRVKGTERLLEAEAKEKEKKEAEIRRVEAEIKRLDELLEEIFKYMGDERVGVIVNKFHKQEIENFSVFMLVVEVMQESVFLRRELEHLKQTIMDQNDKNAGKEDLHQRNIVELETTLKKLREKNAEKAEQNLIVEATLLKVMAGIDELVKIGNCDRSPMLNLLGKNTEVTRWNARSYLRILEEQIQAMIAVSAVKPTLPRVGSGKAASKVPPETTMQVPSLRWLVRKRFTQKPIRELVAYNPCAYCVEDYIMHLVFEHPMEPCDDAYIQGIFHLEDINTPYGIYTLTVPEKRHPFRGGGHDKNTFL